MSAPNQKASLVVQRLDRASDISSGAGLPIKCLVFPATGGVQAIDAAGIVVNLAAAGGALIPTADNVDDIGSPTLQWRYGYFGSGVSAPTLGTLNTGVYANVVKLSNSGTAVNYLNFTNAATGVAPSIAPIGTDTNIDMTLAPKGSGILRLNAPSLVAPAAQTSGIPFAFGVALSATTNTGITAASEASDVAFDLARSVTWAAGAGPLAAQRAVLITAPTYVGNAGTPLVISDAATLAISGPPVQGANMTLTRTHALWVQAGNARFDGTASVGGVAAASAALTVTSTTQGLLLPRMTTGERDAIAAPAAGLVVYNTSTGKLNFRAAAAWEAVTSA